MVSLVFNDGKDFRKKMAHRGPNDLIPLHAQHNFFQCNKYSVQVLLHHLFFLHEPLSSVLTSIKQVILIRTRDIYIFVDYIHN